MSPRDHRAVHEQVSSILIAAEATAERLRVETEQRISERIAEGERAGENRVIAAEAEARDIVKWAHDEAKRVRDAARIDTEKLRSDATSEALTIVARAQDQAEILRAEAERIKAEATTQALEIIGRAQTSADEATGQAQQKARELVGSARSTATELQSEGMELVENLRQMGDSLRANSTRLLRDVQIMHKQMVTQIEAGGGDVSAAGSIHVSRSGEGRPRRSAALDADLDVPEFIPHG